MGASSWPITALVVLCAACATTAQSTTVAVASCSGTAFEYLGTIGETEIGLFFLYMVVLIFLFGGVAVAADIFMGSIEQITSAERKITVGDEEITVLVWNKTVANLSLMALGSSAPEIMLAIIEVVGRGFKAGDLGPGTIVGSAAFNMLMIISVCVSIKEPKRVERINVLYITAFFSVFAYIWLYVIVSGISPGVIDIWEAVVTTLLFPLLLIIAWMADRGWLERKKIAIPIRAASKKIRRSLSKTGRQTRDEQMAMEHLISVGHVAVSAQGTGAWNKKLRAAVRQTRNNNPNMSAEEIYVEAFEIVKGHHGAPVPISRNESDANLLANDNTDLDELALQPLKSFNGGTLASTKADELAASNPDVHVIDVDVAVVSVNADGVVTSSEESLETKLKENQKKRERGLFTLTNTRFSCKKNCGQVQITVVRRDGKEEDVAIDYITTPGTAVENTHYIPTRGRLLFPAAEAKECTRSFIVDILDDGVYGPDKFVGLQLSSPTRVQWKLKDGEIKIKESYKFTSLVDRVSKVSRKFYSQITSDQKADSNWEEQIRVSLRSDGGEADDDEGEEGGTDYIGLFGHYMTLPFKFVFAILTPPVNWAHGYLAFVISLVWIGILTMIIGDVATFMGCTVGLKDSVTAITFVALGTSVPDTFASKIAAEEDDNADPAIGNVTGSNAVNVFLGVGLAWLFGSIKAEMDGEKFIVPEGTIAFSVVIFSIFFIAWFTVLTIRRHWSPIGAELGGAQPYKGMTIGFFVMLWFLFILLSSLVDYGHIEGF